MVKLWSYIHTFLGLGLGLGLGLVLHASNLTPEFTPGYHLRMDAGAFCGVAPQAIAVGDAP